MGSSTATYYVNHDLKVCYTPTRKSYECTAPGYTPEPANHEEDNCCQLHEAYKTIDEQNGSAADQRYVLPCQEEGDQARYDCPCTENAQSSQNIPSLIQCLYYHSVFEKTATHFSNLKVFVCSLCLSTLAKYFFRGFLNLTPHRILSIIFKVTFINKALLTSGCSEK